MIRNKSITILTRTKTYNNETVVPNTAIKCFKTPVLELLETKQPLFLLELEHTAMEHLYLRVQ